MTPEEGRNGRKTVVAEGQEESVLKEFMALVKEICDENDEALKDWSAGNSLQVLRYKLSKLQTKKRDRL